MKAAVVVFPGSNCDRDLAVAFEAAGADVRVLVIGNKVVGAMKRQAQKGEFRSNLHRGGTASTIKLSRTERETAREAAKVLGLRVAGVDLLQTEKGPKILEVNSSPGLEGIEATTGRDIAGMIIEHLESQVRPLSGIREPSARRKRTTSFSGS